MGPVYIAAKKTKQVRYDQASTVEGHAAVRVVAPCCARASDTPSPQQPSLTINPIDPINPIDIITSINSVADAVIVSFFC